MQNFFAAVFSQLYGVFADGTPVPMIMIAVLYFLQKWWTTYR